MRIAIIIERMEPFRGGRETSTAQLAAALARRGQEVTIICQSSSWSQEGVSVLTLGRHGSLRILRLRNFADDARKAIAAGKFDIVHSMLPLPADEKKKLPGANIYQCRGGTVPAQLEASRRRRSKLGGVMVDLAEPWNFCRRQMARWENRVAADPSTHCLTVSQMVAHEFKENYGRTDNVHAIYNAVDMPPADWPERQQMREKMRFQLGVAPADPVFVTVATNFELKGVAETLEAFATWCHSQEDRVHGRLVVLGRDRPERYERMAMKHKISSQVVFAGYRDDMLNWYSAADACILLSWYDPCSRVVLEAMRWGIPSITTTHNGAAEMLTSSGGGIVVESPREIDRIAVAISELSDPKIRQDRSQACLAVAGQLDMERHVDELMEIYNRVIGAKK